MASDPLASVPLQRKSLAQQVAERLRSAIFSGQVRAGAVLRQSTLAREFGVSVIPLREALRQLEGEGLLRNEAHRGVVVADLNAEDVEELVRICGTLDALAFQRALPRLTDEDVDKARATLAALRDERDLARFADLAWDLRFALLRRMESPRLLQLLEMLNKGNRRYYGLLLRDPELRSRVLDAWARRIEFASRRDAAGLLAQLERDSAYVLERTRELLPPAVREPGEERT